MERQTRIRMGMPASVEIVDAGACEDLVDKVFDWFEAVDQRFSPFKADSEVSRFGRGEIAPADISPGLADVLAVAEKTRRESAGFFDIRRPDGRLDPTGIVKGWAIRNAAHMLKAAGLRNFQVEVAGDVETSGLNADGKPWTIGIRNPFNEQEIVKVLSASGRGVATSGTYARGQHIYDPHNPGETPKELVSLTVIGPDILEADRFATAAFAMGPAGITFIDARPGLEGYSIDADGIATMTRGLGAYVLP